MADEDESFHEGLTEKGKLNESSSGTKEGELSLHDTDTDPDEECRDTGLLGVGCQVETYTGSTYNPLKARVSQHISVLPSFGLPLPTARFSST